MRFFRPHFKIATLAGEQDRLISKIGGIPWGLPGEYWPVCCGRPQKLLAQLCHEPPMLDLGSPRAVLHLFECLECLGIGDDCRGEAFLLDESVLGRGLVGIKGHDTKPELGNSLIGELCINGWEEADDGIPDSRLPEFFDEERVWALQEEFPKIDWFGGRESTKFGGTPRWTGNGPCFLPPPFEFLFQVNTNLVLEGLPPNPNEVGCEVTTYTQSESGKSDRMMHAKPDASNRRPNAPWIIMHELGSNCHEVQFTNLGTDGTLYVFIDRTRQPHGVKWLWSR